MRVVVVTVVHGRHDHLRRQQRMIERSQHPVARHLVVSIDDPAVGSGLDGVVPTTVVRLAAAGRRLPLAAARNAGAAAASEIDPELMIFLDVDCLPDPALVDYYVAATELDGKSAGGSLLCGPVAYLPPPPPHGYDLDRLREHPPHPGRPAPPTGTVHRGGDPRLFWSLSFAVTPATWNRVGGFDEGYVGYGAEDTDFAFRAAAAGVPLTWVGGASAFHQWHPVSAPPVEHLDDILRNGARFADRWGWWPMGGWLDAFAADGLIRWDDVAGRWIRASVPVAVAR